MARKLLGFCAAMSDSAKLQLAAIVMLVCGVVGIFYLMR
jgi:hypothetical protein